jgi:hypothetical protein
MAALKITGKVAERLWPLSSNFYVSHPSCQATILHTAVAATNSFRAASRRLCLDAFEIAACMLGARVGEMVCRHGHFKPCPPKYKLLTDRLLTKLERLRKRGRRAYIRIYGEATFVEASHAWQQHVRFVRAFFLFCTCNRQWPLAAGVCRRLLQVEWISYFRDELSELGLEVPPEPELRNLVRRALRMGRRTIRGYGRTWAHENHDVLHERIRTFVVKRCTLPQGLTF